MQRRGEIAGDEIAARVQAALRSHWRARHRARRADVGADADARSAIRTAAPAAARREPVPMSSDAQRSVRRPPQRHESSAASTTVSVSGRGTSTVGRDAQRQAPEFLVAEMRATGSRVEPARGQRAIRRRLRAPRAAAVALRQQLRAAEPQRVADQQPRVELGRFDAGGLKDCVDQPQRACATRPRPSAPGIDSHVAPSAASNSA